MNFSGRAARVVPGLQPYIECLIVELAAQDEDFLGIEMALAAEPRSVGTGRNLVSLVYSPVP